MANSQLNKFDMSNVPTDGIESAPVCIPNISKAEREKRLRLGVVGLVVGLVALGVMMATGISHLWRLPLALVFMGAASGYFQWADKTCVGLAVVNSRKIGDKIEKIEGAELAQVRKQASRVQMKAAVAGIIMAAVAFILP